MGARFASSLRIVLAAGVALLVYAAGIGQVNKTPVDLGPETLEVALPPELQVFLAMGDRYLAANIETFRALVLTINEQDQTTLRVLSEVQKSASMLNPAHEDNYYIAQAVLPWNGLVEPAQFIESRAMDARSWDFLPGFFYAFNRYYFERDANGGAEILLRVADRLDQKEQEGVIGMAALWREKGEDPQLAINLIRAMQQNSRSQKLKASLQVRIDRLQGLIDLRAAAAKFAARHGRPPASLDELTAAGELQHLPQDPLGIGYGLDDKGQPVLLRPKNRVMLPR